MNLLSALLIIALSILTVLCTTAKEKHYLVYKDGTCTAAPNTGPCLGAITRWYWNRQKRKCENHIWGGCGPGGLGFPSKLSCQCQCAFCHKTD